MPTKPKYASEYEYYIKDDVDYKERTFLWIIRCECWSSILVCISLALLSLYNCLFNQIFSMVWNVGRVYDENPRTNFASSKSVLLAVKLAESKKNPKHRKWG